MNQRVILFCPNCNGYNIHGTVRQKKVGNALSLSVDYKCDKCHESWSEMPRWEEEIRCPSCLNRDISSKSIKVGRTKYIEYTCGLASCGTTWRIPEKVDRIYIPE